MHFMQVRGKGATQVMLLELSTHSMHVGGCYVLFSSDGKLCKRVFVWQGEEASRWGHFICYANLRSFYPHRIDKAKVVTVANRIKDEDHAGRTQVVILGTHIHWILCFLLERIGTPVLTLAAQNKELMMCMMRSGLTWAGKGKSQFPKSSKGKELYIKAKW